MAEGSHPFPFRTRKLSPPAPMVLGSRGPGRVGRRRVRTDGRTPGDWGSFVVFRPPIGSPPHAQAPPSRRPSGRSDAAERRQPAGAERRGPGLEAAGGRPRQGRRQGQAGRLGRRGPQGRRPAARRHGPGRPVAGVSATRSGAAGRGRLGARGVDRRGRGPRRGHAVRSAAVGPGAADGRRPPSDGRRRPRRRRRRVAAQGGRRRKARAGRGAAARRPAEAFQRERYEEARRILRPLAEAAPDRGVGPRAARAHLLPARALEAGRRPSSRPFRDLTGTTEQHPVLADCYRALGRHDQVDGAVGGAARRVARAPRSWPRGASSTPARWPTRAGSRTPSACSRRPRPPAQRPQEHHLRVAYALADLHERAGDLPQARQLFGVVAAADPDLGDVEARLRALR